MKGAAAESLEADIRAVLNAHSAENGSDTPDFILARFLMAALGAFNVSVRARDRASGITAKPPLPEEPPVGSVLLDNGGVAWQRLAVDMASAWTSAHTGNQETWAEIQHYAPLRVIWHELPEWERELLEGQAS